MTYKYWYSQRKSQWIDPACEDASTKTTKQSRRTLLKFVTGRYQKFYPATYGAVKNGVSLFCALRRETD